MQKEEFYRFIERGELQGACRYQEYWFCFSRVPEGEGVRVLDLGSGHSALPQAFREKTCYIASLEIDNKSIEYQKSKHIDVFETLLSFPDENLDVVISASAIEHFDPDNDGDIETIAQIYRVLKKGGIFVVTLPVGLNYIKNKYAGTGNSPEKVYSQEEYEKRFGKYFKEEVREIWEASNDEPKDYVPNKNWGYKSVVPAKKLGNGTYICAVWRKL